MCHAVHSAPQFLSFLFQSAFIRSAVVCRVHQGSSVRVCGWGSHLLLENSLKSGSFSTYTEPRPTVGQISLDPFQNCLLLLVCEPQHRNHRSNGAFGLRYALNGSYRDLSIVKSIKAHTRHRFPVPRNSLYSARATPTELQRAYSQRGQTDMLFKRGCDILRGQKLANYMIVQVQPRL